MSRGGAAVEGATSGWCRSVRGSPVSTDAEAQGSCRPGSLPVWLDLVIAWAGCSQGRCSSSARFADPKQLEQGSLVAASMKRKVRRGVVQDGRRECWAWVKKV